ncbi:helix-turn-helix domain-containing protein [Nonomuraea sp. B1E8]|uniref:helix-turn-helix domain-containing protein n=1 Tax=unclassified Nonomuraea TaxID=2593643 RepID=UPI00325C913C
MARAAGVSPATASRATTGGSGVSAEPAAHVRAVASRIGYQKRRQCSGFQTGGEAGRAEPARIRALRAHRVTLLVLAGPGVRSCL